MSTPVYPAVEQGESKCHGQCLCAWNSGRDKMLLALCVCLGEKGLEEEEKVLCLSWGWGNAGRGEAVARREWQSTAL